jgi:hypothetical protein
VVRARIAREVRVLADPSNTVGRRAVRASSRAFDLHNRTALFALLSKGSGIAFLLVDTDSTPFWEEFPAKVRLSCALPSRSTGDSHFLALGTSWM